MPINQNLISFEVDPAGLAVTVDVEDSSAEYLVTGGATITVDNTFGHTGALIHGLTYIWRYRATVIYNGGEVKFHGVAMTADQALTNYDVVARWDEEGFLWNVDFIPDLSANSVIEGAKLVDNTITYDKIQETALGDVILGEATGVAGTIQEIPCTAAGRALLDDANAAAQRTTLGLGTIATQAAATVAITGGTITGITDLAVADGGTGASTAANARTNLGFADGEYTPTLTSVANIAASTAYICQYFQVGNRVHVAGKLDIDPTLAAPTATQIGVSLPIASNFGAVTNAGGVFHCATIAGEGGGISADVANDRVQFEYEATDTGNNTFYFTF